MTSVDAYIADVRRHMTGMDRRVREDILRELRTHLVESTAANGGNVGTALAHMGSPAHVGREYRNLYGYGLGFKVLFIGVAALLAIPTVPVLGVTEELIFPYAFSVPLLVALAGWLVWTGVRAGARVGLAAGLAACASRLVAFGVLLGLVPAATVGAGGLILFLATSGILILLGWLPGTARRAWSGPQWDL